MCVILCDTILSPASADDLSQLNPVTARHRTDAEKENLGGVRQTRGLFSPQPAAPAARTLPMLGVRAEPVLEVASSIPRFYFPGGAPKAITDEQNRRRSLLVSWLCAYHQQKKKSARVRLTTACSPITTTPPCSVQATVRVLMENGLTLAKFDPVAKACNLTCFMSGILFSAIDTDRTGVVTYAQFAKYAILGTESKGYSALAWSSS